jgi:hypothetical protein
MYKTAPHYLNKRGLDRIVVVRKSLWRLFSGNNYLKVIILYIISQNWDSINTKTSYLMDLARALGCLMVVTPQKPSFGAGFAEPPSEVLTASCRQNGLEEAYDSGFEEE